MLLEGGGDGGLARGGQAGEPDGETLLLAGLVALLAREGGVPGDVAASGLSAISGRENLERATAPAWRRGSRGEGERTYVAIVSCQWENRFKKLAIPADAEGERFSWDGQSSTLLQISCSSSQLISSKSTARRSEGWRGSGAESRHGRTGVGLRKGPSPVSGTAHAIQGGLRQPLLPGRPLKCGLSAFLSVCKCSATDCRHPGAPVGK